MSKTVHKIADLYFGGSFDPPHLGHLYGAQEALTRGGFTRVLFVPTGQNPLKTNPDAALPLQRLEMVRRAIADNDSFVVSDIEIDLSGPSYTVDTVTQLIARGALSARPGMVIGDDLLPQLERWKNLHELLSLVRPVVLRRETKLGLPSFLPADTLVIDNTPLPISSQEIRGRLREGRSIRYLVPRSVYEWIDHERLYR